MPCRSTSGRVQFTPDLMPSDITGTEILQEGDQPGRRSFEYVKGPIFANIVLADESTAPLPKRSRRSSKPCRNTA